MDAQLLVIPAIVFLGGAGFLLGFILAFAAEKFSVKTNPLEEKLLSLLPGANCGACGYPGCSGYAESMASGKAEPGKCPVLSSQEAINEIFRLMGKEPVVSNRKTAVIFCGGGNDCRDNFEYKGIESCAVASRYYGGPKSCEYGCIGLGDCARVCPFGAITYKKGEVPLIDEEKCTACGLCVEACPKKIIHLVECKYRYHIRCSSLDKGARVRQICPPGCIGCGICVKSCPQNDIILENNLARMKYDRCDNCGICMEKCPTRTIARWEIKEKRWIIPPKKQPSNKQS